MLSKKFLSHYEIKSKKIIYILLILIILISVYCNPVKAAQYTEKYTSSAAFNSTAYPGYATLIDSLKQAHPNWTFTMLYTGLDWNQVIKNETTARHGRNLVDGSKTGEWVCSQCSSTAYDNGSWKCASEATVSYYMDPRNALFEDYVFQFESLKWSDDVYTEAGINKILSDCAYMKGNTITYTKTDGTTGTIQKSYAKVILEAAQENGISAYHLASRIRQEQGPGTYASATATGTYAGYKGYYNFFNVNAYGSGSSTIIKNALEYAKEQGWTDPEKSIKGGAQFVADEYINCGQSTLYLQKFDVDNSDGDLYWHQYMQNVSAAKSESSTILSTYRSIDANLNQKFNFIIPVYENMPTTRCPQPASQSIVTQNVQVIDQTAEVRETRSASGKLITTLNKDDTILRIEIGNSKIEEHYWDKVVLSNGTKGYIISDKIKLLDDNTNCNIMAVAKEPGNVRNGPGTSGTTIITTLTVGQAVNIIEKDVYKNIDNENWTRIYLSDGRQGYIVARYLEEISNPGTNPNTEPEQQELVEVVTSVGLSVREKPGTNQKILKVANKGEYLTRIAKNVSNDNNYIWDKIITADGIEGYVARGDKDGDYIKPVTETAPGINGNGFKTFGINIVCEPNITVENLKQVASDAVIKNVNGQEITTGNIGTGYTIKIHGTTYTLRKLGDATGDGEVTSADYVRVKNYLRKKIDLDLNQKYASDVTGEGDVTSADYVRIKNYLRKKASIVVI